MELVVVNRSTTAVAAAKRKKEDEKQEEQSSYCNIGQAQAVLLFATSSASCMSISSISIQERHGLPPQVRQIYRKEEKTWKTINGDLKKKRKATTRYIEKLKRTTTTIDSICRNEKQKAKI
jgi:hypothetical protein